MSGRAAGRLARGLAAACFVLAVPTLILLALGMRRSSPADSFGLGGAGGLSFLVASLAFVTVGALIVSRMPGHPVGWGLCAIGVCVVVGDYAFQHADHALFGPDGAGFGGAAAAWLQNIAFPPVFGMLAVCLLLFPDGRPLSRRWWPALALAAGGALAVALAYAFRSGPLDSPFERVTNPLGIDGTHGALEALAGVGWLAMTASAALAAAAIALRLRRSSGVERQQLKWIALAGAVAGVMVVLSTTTFFLSVKGVSTLRFVVLGPVFAGLPIAAGIAILRYRLYDIDVVVNRTLVYGGLTATLVGAYLGTVLVLQLALSPLTQRSDLAIAGSTLAVAALFGPARRRIQAGVDRRFYRRRYDAARTLEAFGARLRDQVDIDALGADLRHVVADTMQPAHVSLWLREGGA